MRGLRPSTTCATEHVAPCRGFNDEQEIDMYIKANIKGIQPLTDTCTCGGSMGTRPVLA